MLHQPVAAPGASGVGGELDQASGQGHRLGGLGDGEGMVRIAADVVQQHQLDLAVQAVRLAIEGGEQGRGSSR